MACNLPARPKSSRKTTGSYCILTGAPSLNHRMSGKDSPVTLHFRSISSPGEIKTCDESIVTDGGSANQSNDRQAIISGVSTGVDQLGTLNIFTSRVASNTFVESYEGRRTTFDENFSSFCQYLRPCASPSRSSTRHCDYALLMTARSHSRCPAVAILTMAVECPSLPRTST